jgi:ubiquitin-protein ligase
MISPRVRRLIQDQERLQLRFGDSRLIRISGTAGMPPEVYRFTYHIKGLYVDPAGQILARPEHLLEVNLSLGYPRRAPQCRMLTPIFHPNFDAASVCIGDFWAASEALDDLIVRVGRMIAYQEYNTKSPLNGLAARWAVENPYFLPVDDREISPPMIAGQPIPFQSPEPPSSEDPRITANVHRDGTWPDKVVIS